MPLLLSENFWKCGNKLSSTFLWKGQKETKFWVNQQMWVAWSQQRASSFSGLLQIPPLLRLCPVDEAHGQRAPIFAGCFQEWKGNGGKQQQQQQYISPPFGPKSWLKKWIACAHFLICTFRLGSLSQPKLALRNIAIDFQRLRWWSSSQPLESFGYASKAPT